MKKILFLGAAALSVVSFCGCSDDINFESGEGEGRVLLRPLIESDVAVKARSAATDDELGESVTIWISNPKGVVRKFSGLSELPAGGVTLLSDNYVAEAWAGDSVPASFEDRYFKGLERFTVQKNSTQQVEIECKIANSAVEVRYDGDVEDYISECSMTVGHKAGSLVFEGETAARTGYFMMPSFDPDLAYTFTAKNINNGSEVKYSGVIKDAKPATKYVLKIKHDGPQDPQIGAGIISIEVDETELEVKDVIEIYSAPEIKGLNFDINAPVTGEAFTLTEKKLWITCSAAFESLTLSCSGLSQMLGISGDAFEYFGMDASVREAIAGKGIEFQLFNHEDTGFAEMKITLTDKFMALFGNGDYKFTVSATDTNGRRMDKVIDIMVSDAEVMAVQIPDDALTTWFNRATVRGQALKDGLSSLGFNYRRQGDAAWTFVEAAQQSVASGEEFSVELSGLTPATTYEYKAVANGTASSNTGVFTTEGTAQITNGGFEDWCTEGSITYPSPSKSNLYWDSGNTGASVARATLTSAEPTKKHSGNYSARLESKRPGFLGIGKFAAGNIFIGEYLKTDGTDGVLGWGRPFSGRPSALKGYVHYTPATVNYNESGGAYDEIKIGEMDKGIIYIALLDDTQSEYEGKKYPVIVKTKASDRHLFSKTDANVIAYGELILDNATSGDNLVEFNIPLTYQRTDVKPSNIMIVCAASKGGDYFTGGVGSLMYLDDFELVYE